MSNSTFEKKQVVGTSKKSVSDAIESVVKQYSASNPVYWFEVTEIRGRVTQTGEIEYQVTVNLGQKTN
ncbi:MAG: dodecin domain-containing protein [Ignavibacteria bacterium]|nr:dodecin domain-containing protein [Ignavibacteria bacterium]